MFALTYQFFCATVMLGSNASNKVPSWFLSSKRSTTQHTYAYTHTVRSVNYGLLHA